MAGGSGVATAGNRASVSSGARLLFFHLLSDLHDRSTNRCGGRSDRQRSAAAGRGHPAPRLTRCRGDLGRTSLRVPAETLAPLRSDRPTKDQHPLPPNILLSIRLAPPVPNIFPHLSTEQTPTSTWSRPASASSMLNHLLTCSDDLAGADCETRRPPGDQHGIPSRAAKRSGTPATRPNRCGGTPPAGGRSSILITEAQRRGSLRRRKPRQYCQPAATPAHHPYAATCCHDNAARANKRPILAA